MIYYPIPLHKQKVFKKDFNNDFNNDDYPVSNLLESNVLSLPIHTELTEETINYIVETIKKFK